MGARCNPRIGLDLSGIRRAGYPGLDSTTMGNNMTETLHLQNGKYTLQFSEGSFTALRGGEPWRDLTGDKLVLALFQRIRQMSELQERILDRAYAVAIGEASLTLPEVREWERELKEVGDDV